MRCSGSDPTRRRRTSVSDRSGVSRGDRNRNARLARLREAVPLSNAIVGIDLADSKQMVVVTDHESRVLARRTFRRRAWELGAALDWAAARAAAAGFAGVTCRGRADRAPVAGGRAAGRRARHAVCVRAAADERVGPAGRGPDLRQDRRQGRGADHPADRAAALLSARAGRCDLGAAAAAGHSPGPAGRRVGNARCSRCGTCSSAPGPRCWTPPGSRSSPPPGTPR